MNIEKNEISTTQAEEPTLYSEAYGNWLESRLNEMIDAYKEKNIISTVSINFFDDKLSIVGNVYDLSYKNMEKVLSEALDFDLSGSLEIGLKFSATFPLSFFDEFITNKDANSEDEELKEIEDSEMGMSDNTEKEVLERSYIKKYFQENKLSEEGNNNVPLNKPFITKWFNALNSDLFGGVLVIPPLKFSKSKRFIATVYADPTPLIDGTYLIKSLEFSKVYELPMDVFMGILVHEMIHIELLQHRGIVSGKDGHGVEFEARRKELNRITDYHIPKTESVDLKVVPIKGKNWDVVLIEDDYSGGSYDAIVYKGGYLNQKSDALRKYFEHRIKYSQDRGRPISVIAYNTDYPQVHPYPVSRGFPKNKYKGLRLFKFPKPLGDYIKENGTILFSLT